MYTLSVADADADAGEDVGGCARLQHSSSSDADDSLLLSLDWSGGGIADAKVGKIMLIKSNTVDAIQNRVRGAAVR